MMEQYQYDRLRRPKDSLGEIRLVRIRHGNFEDPIRVAIHHDAIEDVAFSGGVNNERYVWRALSYTWGDPENTERILVESNEETDTLTNLRYLSVTNNLTEALKHIRSPERDCIMWVDAISIDQSTDTAALEERAWQVKIMHHIYSRAAAVIIWLGPEADDSSYALQLLHDLGSSMKVDWQTFAISTLEGEPTAPMKQWDSGQLDRDSREFKALWTLLGRPWFSRTWVRQEALFAEESRSVMCCGMKSVRLADFRKAIHYLNAIAVAGTLTRHVLEKDYRLGRALSICERTYMDEPNLMSRIRLSECRDPRDKVYGNLGVMNIIGNSSLAASIKVDYSETNTTENVYQDFFLRHHQRYGTLRLLNEAGLRQGSLLRQTWLPDWRCNFVALDLSMESSTSHFAQAECTLISNEILQVLGCPATEIIETQVMKAFDAHDVRIDSYRGLYSLMETYVSFGGHGNAVERFNYALCCPLSTMRFDMDILLEHRRNIKSYVQYIFDQTMHDSPLKEPEEILGKQAAWFLQQCIIFLQQPPLPFIFCKHGFVGVGPQGAQKGDVVAAILGSRALILLRPTREKKYQVVGPCFVHGLNWGEALLGPLRDHIVVPHLEASRGAYVPYYLHVETNTKSMWDPRIAWDELRAHPPMVNFDVVQAPPEEPLRCRPNSEYLKKHGVILKSLLLV